MERKPQELKQQEDLPELRAGDEETASRTQSAADSSPANKAYKRAESLIGKTVGGHYEIISLLSSGGMSAVFKARHQVLHRIMAIKVVLSDDAVDEYAIRRFKQEAQATIALNHPNIVKVTEFGVDESAGPFLVMEWIDGPSLADLFKSGQQLGTERSVSIARQACDALENAHQSGIIHRDIKPGNIMLLKDAEGHDLVKVVDFGIAKVLSGEELQQHLTQTGEMLGTPQYMSPEQCLGNSLDKRSDIYSLGCVVYELLSGKPPHRGDNVLQTLHKHVSETAAAIAGVSPQLNRVVLKAMAKEPQDRFQSASEFSAALADPSAVPAPVRKPPPRSPKKLGIFLVAACALVLMAITLSAIFVCSLIPPEWNPTKTNPDMWTWHYSNDARGLPYDEYEQRQDQLDKSAQYIKGFLRNPKSLNRTELAHHLSLFEGFLLDDEGTTYEPGPFYPYYERCSEAGALMKKLIAIPAIAKDPHLAATVHEIASLSAFGKRDYKGCELESQNAIDLWKQLKEIYTKPYYRTQLRLANAMFLSKDYDHAMSEYLKSDMVAYPRVIKNLYDPRLAFLHARMGDCRLHTGFPEQAAAEYSMAEPHWLSEKYWKQDAAIGVLYLNYIGATTGNWQSPNTISVPDNVKGVRFDERCLPELRAAFKDSQYYPVVLRQYASVLWKEKRYLEALQLSFEAQTMDVSRKEKLGPYPILKNELQKQTADP